MKKKLLSTLFTYLLAVSLILACALTATACSDGEGSGEQTNTPQGTAINPPTGAKIGEDGVVVWTRVVGAASYDVEVNGVVKNAKFTRFDLYELDDKDKPDNGVFSVKLRSVAKDGSKSEWGETLSYTMSGGLLLYPVLTGIENGVISWDPNDNASGTVITVNGDETDLSSDTSFDLSGISGTEIVFSIKFVGDGVYYKDSKTTTVIYYPATGEFRLPKPQNVRMEGQILKFDEVIGADVYYLRDYNNTVVSVNSNEIDMSAGYLTKSVKAGISSGVYSDSEEVEVSYFAEESGTGTEQDPFVITTPDEFRYIEFYEGIGEAKHYVLGNDVEFEEIELKDDEFGSNTYKLGSFSGVLDGKNYALKNVKVYYRDGYSSLFSSINEGAAVKNLVFDNADWRTWTVKSNDSIMHEKGGLVAILCYTNRGLISNVKVKNSSVTAVVDGAAGFCSINRGEIKGCVLDKNTQIFGNKEAGGVVIFNEGTVSDCINYGTVKGNANVGGITGYNAGTVTACSNEGGVNGGVRVGGIAGYNYNILLDGEYDHVTEIRYCSNSGTVSGATIVGGLVGQNGGDGTEEMGFVSVSGAGIVSCYNVGEVKGANILGGIVGNNFSSKGKNRGVIGCYNAGNLAVNQSGSGYTRYFVDASACSFVASDNAVMRCHYWGTDSSTWPGVEMHSFNYGEKLYYFVDVPSEGLNGLKFNRVDYSGNVFNSTPDLAPVVGYTKYELAADFDSLGYFNAVEDAAYGLSTVAGGISGYSASVENCFYMRGTANAVSSASGPLQQNTVNINGENSPALSVKDGSDMKSAAFVDLLNSLSDSQNWIVGEDFPKFAWQ